MHAKRYQLEAQRTICNQTEAFKRLCGSVKIDGEDCEIVRLDPVGLRNVQLLHAIIGMMGEIGELATQFERTVWYGKDGLDVVNVGEEVGDMAWYMAEGLSAVGIPMDTCLEANINKLRARFPNKFDSAKGDEKLRDLDTERSILEQMLETEGEPLDIEITIDGEQVPVTFVEHQSEALRGLAEMMGMPKNVAFVTPINESIAPPVDDDYEEDENSNFVVDVENSDEDAQIRPTYHATHGYRVTVPIPGSNKKLSFVIQDLEDLSELEFIS